MRQAQLLAYDVPTPLLEGLRLLAQDRALWLREVRDPKSCLNLLVQAGAGVFVVHLGQKPETELALLEHVTRLLPEIPAIACLTTPHPSLAALAWDLGAAYVAAPPQSGERVLEVVTGFLR